jgi:signal transduction histidine kinase/ligand-binding sensor domain-containing protein
MRIRPTQSPRYESVLRRAAVLALAIALLFSLQAKALDPSRTLTQALLRKWQVQQGLPQATISSIRQTDDHFLWLGTPAGLFRFDGVRFTDLRDIDPSLPDDLWVQDLCEDAQHNLWIATDGAGLIRLADGTARRFGPAEGLTTHDVRALLSDRSGVLWAATADGLARLNEGQAIFYHQEQGLSIVDLRAVCQALDGTIWVGGKGRQLFRRNGSEFTPTNLDSLPESATVNALSVTRDGAVWAGTTDGLVRLKGGTELRFTTQDGLADDWVHCVAEGHAGGLWVGTKDGISRVRDGEIESFRARDGLSQSTAYALCEDHEGSLWVGTKLGLNQFVDRRTIPFTASEGLPSNDTGPVFQDRSGTIWVGTLDAGLARLDGRQFSVAAHLRQGLPSDTIRALADGDDGELWIGSEDGVCRMREGEVVENLTTEMGLPSNQVRCFCRDSTGTLWTGTMAGVAQWRDGRFVEPASAGRPFRLPVVALVDDGRGSLIVATEGGGLFRVADGQVGSYTLGDKMPRDVDAFFRDADGLVWVGTRGDGLWLIEGDRAIQFTVKDGLYDDELFGVAADDDGRLWMACSRGGFFVEIAELRRFAAGTTDRLTSTPFSPTDAQRAVECQAGVQPAVWKMQDGRIWFSTILGLLVIDPRHMQRRLPPLRVVVDGVKINGHPENPRQIGDVPPGRTSVEFHYTALSYASPTRTTFHYRLVNFDKEWIDAGARREAFYTNLPPGSYTFRVRAATLDGTSNEAAGPVTFTLQPYLYQRTWFLPSALGLAALTGWIAYRLRVRRIKAQWRAVLAERNRIARELHDTLMQGFSGVTMQLQALAARLPESRERGTLDEIIADAGICLREARRSVAGLRSTPDGEPGLASAVAQAARQITETHDVRLLLRLGPGPEGLAADVEYNLIRIVQEAVTNAVKHAGASTIEIVLDASPQRLRISIRDDGAGFDADADGHLQGEHYGLIGMRERASQIGADLRLTSEPGRGTTVTLERPTAPASASIPNGAASPGRRTEERAT